MDNFDEIWRNKFREESPDLAKWNSPANRVWEMVELELRKAHKRRVIYYLVLSLGLILALLTIIFMLTADVNKSSAQSHLKQAASEADQIQKTLKNTTSSALLTEMSKTSDILTHKKIIDLKSDKEVTSQINQTKAIFTESSLSPSLPSFDVNEDLLEYSRSDFVGNLFIDSNIEKGYPNEAVRNTTPSNIELLDLPWNIIPNEVSFLDFMESTWQFDEIPEVSGGEKSLFFSYRFAALSWSQRLSRSFSEDLSPFDFMSKNATGYSGGIELTKGLNAKFSLRGGIGIEWAKLNSSHNSDLYYLSIDESMGEFSNHYFLDLATPYGFAPTDIVLHRLGDIQEEEVHMKVDLTSLNRIVNWSMPVSLDFYPLGNKGRWRPSLNIGGALNYLHSVRTVLNDANTHHDRIRYIEKSKELKLKSGINQVHFDLRIGSGLSYQLTHKFLISAQYEYARGINAVFKSGDYSTMIDRHIMTLIVGYRL